MYIVPSIGNRYPQTMSQPDTSSSSFFGTIFSFFLVLVFTVFMAFTSVRTYYPTATTPA